MTIEQIQIVIAANKYDFPYTLTKDKKKSLVIKMVDIPKAVKEIHKILQHETIT